jgi:copper chaperone NosL
VAGALAMPLWRVQLYAPQYPEGLGMTIHAGTVRGATENDLRSINSLNHYIGMKTIEPDAIPELRFIPWIIAALAAGGIGVAALGRRRTAIAWVGAFVVLGLAGIWDFYKWEYSYGHDLDLEHAIIKVPGMTYQPPLIGSKQLLNFTASSWPAIGGACLAAAMVLAIASLMIDRQAPSPVSSRRESRLTEAA